MVYQLVFAGPRKVEIREYPEKSLAPNEVRLRTLYSGISAGTESSQFNGTNPYLQKQWDPRRRLFVQAGSPSLTYPLADIGYEEVGEVIEVGSGVRNAQVGDVIYGIWRHRTSHVVTEEYASRRILPRGLDPVLGIFSHIGPVALNGIHDAQILIGDGEQYTQPAPLNHAHYPL